MISLGVRERNIAVSKIRKIFIGPTYKLLLSFTVILDVCISFISNKTTFDKYCLTQWIPKLPGSFETHWVRQPLANFMGLAGIVNTIVYKTDPIFTVLGHTKLSNSSTPHGIIGSQRVKWRRTVAQNTSNGCELTDYMMTSSNGNIFRVTGHLCGEFIGPRWIPRTKASDAELWCLLWSAPE